MPEFAGYFRAGVVVGPSHLRRHVLALRPARQRAGEPGQFQEPALGVLVPQAVRAVDARLAALVLESLDLLDVLAGGNQRPLFRGRGKRLGLIQIRLSGMPFG